MNLMWGIKPFHVAKIGNTTEFMDEICRWGIGHDLLCPGDRIVFMAGTHVLEKIHNSVVVHTLSE